MQMDILKGYPIGSSKFSFGFWLGVLLFYVLKTYGNFCEDRAIEINQLVMLSIPVFMLLSHKIVWELMPNATLRRSVVALRYIILFFCLIGFIELFIW